MKRLLTAAFALVLALGGCALNMGQDARFGMYGGKPREARPVPPFDVQSTEFDARWFPAYVRWAPDDSHLLVSLCHVKKASYCRIGKYWLAEQRWELLDLQPQVTYRWPSYSPDGQTIVAVAGGCDQNYVCPERRYTLVLLSNDGKRTVKLAETLAKQPTFSDDGKKIIYWRYSGGGGADVAMFDLTTGQEKMLTKLLFWGSDIRGGVFFLPGGQRFVFGGWLPILFGSRNVIKDGKNTEVYVIDEIGTTVPTYPLEGTKLDRSGPNGRTIRYVGDIRKDLITKANILEVDLLWPDNGMSSNNGGTIDVSRDGQVLYSCAYYRCYDAKIASGQYRANKIDLGPNPDVGTGFLMLRPADEKAFDSTAFHIAGRPSISAIAISNDQQRIAFSESPETGWYRTYRFGIATFGNSTPIFIDWPRLDLDPAATQRVITD